MERRPVGFFPVHSLISCVDAHGWDEKNSECYCYTSILNFILEKLLEGKKERQNLLPERVVLNLENETYG